MQKIIRLVAFAALAAPCVSPAVELMPDFGDVPTGWVTDRYDPDTFANIGLFSGRSDVLAIGIDTDDGLTSRPAGYQSTFYNTQGKQHAVSGGAGSTLSADLWVDASWLDAGNGHVRTDMWGIMDGGASLRYPIIGFTNYGGAARFRYWDEDTAAGWVDSSAVVNAGAWNSFSIEFTGLSLVYSINGTVIGTDSTLGGATGFSAVIMQAYNFAGDSSIAGANAVDYTAHWSNAQASVPDAGATVGLFAGALLALAALRRRLA